MNILGQAGDFLGGMKADLRGEGVSYRAARDARREGSLRALDTGRIKAMAEDARVVQGLIGAGATDIAASFLEDRVENIKRLDGDPSDTMEVLEMIRSGDIENASAELDTFVRGAKAAKILSPAGVQSSRILPNGTTIMALDDQSTIVIGADGKEVSEGEANKAIQEASDFKVSEAERLAGVEIDKATRRKRAELTEARTSGLITDMSERNRNSARAGRRVSEALQLSAQAIGGITAGIAVKLSKLIPGIDVEDEAALDAALTQISLDQLQSFKGPTTDFEYGVTENIAGSITDNKQARTAKLKSLQRAEWFNQREVKQFKKHIDSGGNADNFAFNFGEEIRTKKGMYTLKDLQETAVANHISIEEVIKALDK